MRKIIFFVVVFFFLTYSECFASPAGQIVFIRDGNIWIASIDGTNAKQLTFSRNNRYPAISGDGKLIAFTSGYDNKTGFGHLYTMTPQC